MIKQAWKKGKALPPPRRAPVARLRCYLHRAVQAGLLAQLPPSAYLCRIAGRVLPGFALRCASG